MSADQYMALVIVLLAAVALITCIAVVAVGAKSGERFDRHVQDDLDLIADDDRNTRLDANKNGTGWY